MKPNRKVHKMETPWSVAVKLGAHFGVAAESAIQWFESGCPKNFEEAVAWKETRIEEAKLRKPSSPPNKFEKALQQAPRANAEVNWDILSPEFSALVETICDLYLAGCTVYGIESRLGATVEVINRILSRHPRTKDREKEFASLGWAEVRRLALGEMLTRLSNPIERSKIKSDTLNIIAGVAQDKLDKVEAPKEVTLSLKAKVDAMSYEDLMKALFDKSDVIDGEFQMEGNETSPKEDGNLLKPLPQSQQEPQKDATTDTDGASN